MNAPTRVALRAIPAAESRALIDGRRQPPAGLAWADEYPMDDTVVALNMLTLAYAGLGVPVVEPLTWWCYQIVVETTTGPLVVGDIGFHGPPDEDGAVEVGYYVVPSWRGQGIATAACRLLVERARDLGAERIEAEVAADNPSSRAVLAAAGFTQLGESRFVVGRTAP